MPGAEADALWTSGRLRPWTRSRRRLGAEGCAWLIGWVAVVVKSKFNIDLEARHREG